MLTFQKYNAIRILLESGETVEVVAETFQCKQETVLLVKRCNTYDQYKQECISLKAMAKARAAKEKKKTENAGNTTGSMNIGQIKIEATHYMMEELKRNNELLTLISNKLTAIMEELGVIK